MLYEITALQIWRGLARFNLVAAKDYWKPSLPTYLKEEINHNTLEITGQPTCALRNVPENKAGKR